MTLKRKPLISKLVKMVQGKILKEHNKKRTVKVSINCDAKVEKLLRNHKCLPCVSFFQKWKILISINCAHKYAIIEAKTAKGDKPKT